MCHLGKGYIQKNIQSGTTRIGEGKHPDNQTPTKTNTVDTNQTLTNNTYKGRGHKHRCLL